MAGYRDRPGYGRGGGYGGSGGYGGGGWGGFARYVPVAERRARAARAMAKRQKAGHSVSPVVIEGRAIATTFWGKSWCQNLERYSDFANRLPRGRTYVRNGSVVNLQVSGGKVDAHVSGSTLYQVSVKVAPVPEKRWKAICADCAGSIDSLVELLQGEFEEGVMERLCRQDEGLFPAPSEISLGCSCPDVADMCKHVAAVLYGIGARLDHEPSLLFRLRAVSEQDLIAGAAEGLPLAKKTADASKVLAAEDVSAVFGVEMDAGESTPLPPTPPRPPRAKSAKSPKRATSKPAAAPPKPAKGAKGAKAARSPTSLPAAKARRPKRR